MESFCDVAEETMTYIRDEYNEEDETDVNSGIELGIYRYTS